MRGRTRRMQQTPRIAKSSAQTQDSATETPAYVRALLPSQARHASEVSQQLTLPPTCVQKQGQYLYDGGCFDRFLPLIVGERICLF